MKITVLVENTLCDNAPELHSEMGLSLYIEFNGHRFLFDTGASGAFAKNAEHMGIDPGSVTAAVLSHHHYDHGGGLRRFFEVNKDAKVYRGKSPAGRCIFKAFRIMRRDIGLDDGLVDDYSDRFEVIDKLTEILPDVFIIPQIEKTFPIPKGNKYFYVKQGPDTVPDDFAHEIVMVIKDRGELVIFTGCSHSGVLNMIDAVAKKFEDIPIKAVIGGFHLVNLPMFNTMAGTRSEVEDIGEKIREYQIDALYTGHCTGMKGYKVLKVVMGNRFHRLQTGACIDL